MKPTLKDGLATPFRAISFLFSNLKLVRYFLIPLSINIVIFGLGTWAFFHYFGELLNALFNTPEVWYQYIIYYFAATVLGLLFAVALVFGFTAVGNLIASPFNDVLSERTEEIRTGKNIDEPFSFKVLMGDAQTAVGNELRKIGLLILIQVTLLIINFVPIVGTVIYAICSPLSVIFFLAYEYMDFSLSRKRLRFGEKWRLIFDHKGACFGMGATFFFTTVIPFVNFFVMPVAVISATLLYVQIQEGPSDILPPDDDLEPPSIDEVVDDVLSNT